VDLSVKSLKRAESIRKVLHSRWSFLSSVSMRVELLSVLSLMSVSITRSSAVEAGDPEAIDVYLCEQDAQRALEDCLRDEPQWRGLLRVEEVELSADKTSLN